MNNQFEIEGRIETKNATTKGIRDEKKTISKLE